MKYSVAFLDYDPQGINRETTLRAIDSIIECSKDYDWEFNHIKNVKGFVHAVNAGLHQATGDYLVTVANDVFLRDPEWLMKLTSDDSIVGWKFAPFVLTGEMRPDFACWSISRKIYEIVGDMDIEFENGYGYDDDDYVYRIREAGFGVKDAQIALDHLESLTYNTIFGPEKAAMTERNKQLYLKKHPL